MPGDLGGQKRVLLDLPGTRITDTCEPPCVLEISLVGWKEELVLGPLSCLSSAVLAPLIQFRPQGQSTPDLLQG